MAINPNRPIDVICTECGRSLRRYNRPADVPMGTTVVCYTCDGGVEIVITEHELWQRPVDRLPDEPDDRQPGGDWNDPDSWLYNR